MQARSKACKSARFTTDKVTFHPLNAQKIRFSGWIWHFGDAFYEKRRILAFLRKSLLQLANAGIFRGEFGGD
ncbi:MAG: hypothetical protein MJY99_10905, partial [Fibrobacter sp.]|nr:hypothetical protein [Fibrobacter sp.]